MRRLSTIRTIASVDPIEGADAIEVVTIDGWKVVSKKGEFKPGDLAVYFEIDSVLPNREEFEFLRKGCYVKKDWLVTDTNPTGEGFRLKTIKLRGQVSQGLVLPINTFLFKAVPEDGMCIDGITGVVKWDPPVPASLAGKVRGNFPSFIPKTDQERIQNIKPADLEKYRDDLFEVTMKLDGSSMTVYSYNDDHIGVCSRNLEIDWENDPDNIFAKVLVESGLREILKEHPGLAIQGELMGPGIQGNRENLDKHYFYVFDMYNIENGQYLSSEERLMILQRIHNNPNSKNKLIRHCPVVGYYKAAKFTPAELLAEAVGPSIVNKVREGLVYKSVSNPDFSFKAISNKFLLKGGE